MSIHGCNKESQPNGFHTYDARKDVVLLRGVHVVPTSNESCFSVEVKLYVKHHVVWYLHIVVSRLSISELPKGLVVIDLP